MAHENSQKGPLDYSKLTPEQLAEELRQLTEQTDAIVASTGFLRFAPLKYQEPWYAATNEIRPVVAPNQQGKTTWGAIETISGCTGMRPIALGGKDQARPQRGSKRGYRALVAGESFDALRDNVLPKFAEFISPGMLNGAPKKNAEGFPYLWRFATGAEAVFMSYQQDVSVFEGAVWDRAWFDEPPPQSIFNAVRRGLMARRGKVDLSLTPLKEAWILDELIEPGKDPDSPLYGAVAQFPPIDIHANCVLEGSRVSGRITGALKAFYSGPAVEIHTVGGERFRVTANHPVLTANGIVPAGSLNKGVALLRQRREVVARDAWRDQYEEHRQDPLVEDVFEALATQRRGVTHCGRLDLDGDERLFLGDQVDVVGMLARTPETPLVDHGLDHEVGNLPLVPPDSPLTPGSIAERLATTATGLPRGRELPLDGGPVVAEVAPANPLLLGRAAQLDAVLPKAALKSLDVAACFFGDLATGFPGLVERDEVSEIREFDFRGHVYDLSTDVGYFSSDNILVRNCAQCNPGVGVLPHDRILTFLALVPPAERAAREFGIFAGVADLEFPYVLEDTHVVPDIDVRRWGWPVVEIVDPAMKRPLHCGWFTVDPDENWYWFHAAQVPNDGFSRMVRDIQAHRRFVGRQPDLAIMDRRGGKHRIDAELKQDWFEKFRKAGIDYRESVDTHVQTLHDWMRPSYNPAAEQKEVPKLRICRSVAEMQKGPLWAFRRFVWVADPTKRDRKFYEQTGKDWVDLAMYLRAAEPTFKKLLREEGPLASGNPLAMSYQSSDVVDPPDRRTRSRESVSLAESYATPSDWRRLIPRGYS